MAKEPEKLGKYNIVGKLGKGAMGEVFKGHDPVLNRYVAIKVIAESLDSDSDLVERFRREAKMAAQLNHPNIITIYDFVEEDGALYIVMELLDGRDLKEVIKSGSPLTVDQILGIMEQIADGLGFAHDSGMVHRDLKPANIHITKKGQIKILDFGLVHEASSDMTKTGHIMGTPNYMSPEQVQGLKVDPRSDIFSLGAVFYELLTRKKPFSADSIHATMFKVVQGEREPLSQYTQLPAPLVGMVDRALDPNPDGRFGDGNDLRQHLRTVRREMTAALGADATMTGAEKMDATVLTPTVEPGSHPSHPSARSSVSARSGRSVPTRATPGASASGSRGGTMRRRELASHSVGVAVPSRPVGLYVGGAILVAAIAAGLFYLSGQEPQGPSVEELSQQLSTSQQELMIQSLEQRDYESALSRADTLLASDPGNPEAQRVQREAQEALDEIDTGVADARAALERGATEEAAEALGRVLALDPSHPLGAELNDQLNQHFQSQAEGARSAMESANNAASSAGASSRPEYRQAERARQEADADFEQGEYTNAAQQYLAARDLFQQSETAHRQAEAQRRQQAEREATSRAQQAQARQALQEAESRWTRLRNQPLDAGVADQPSYQRALSEEAAAQELAGSGDLAAAARAYDTASGYLEAAKQEHTDAQSRTAAAATPPPAPTSAPVTSSAPATSPAPSRVQIEEAIRQTLATYERAIESKDIALFRRAKPNLTSNEAKRLTDSFEAVDSHDVEIDVQTVTIDGGTATAVVSRRDTIVIRGRTQNGNTRQQTFVLQNTGGGWVITEIQ